MTKRRVLIIILCEDTQQEVFVRKFLGGMGYNTRMIRVEKTRKGFGSGEQQVRMTFVDELKKYRERRNKAATSLITIIDADTKTVSERIEQLKESCTINGISFRNDTEAVAIICPKRNIETWIHFCNGKHVDEVQTYRKLQKERDCSEAVRWLVETCKTTGMDDNAPPSLLAACEEYKTRIAAHI